MQQIRDLKEQLAGKSSALAAPCQVTVAPSPAQTSIARGQTLDTISLSGKEISSLFDMYAQKASYSIPLG
jgi:hypothetical protein